MKAKHIFVTGKVQGVGYRNFTLQEAIKLGLVGWVRNVSDGRVEIQVAGIESDIEKFIKKLEQGPVFSRVDGLEIKDLTETVDSDEFVIL